MKTVTILPVIGLIAILSCCKVSGNKPGRQAICQLSPERGRCRMSHPRWHYDSASGECRNFTYGGCGGNANRFDTKNLCEIVCKPGCRHESCTRTCPNGFIIDSHGCNTCRCQPASEQNLCPSLECDNACQRGYQTDSEGCMTCDCRAEGAQPRVVRTSSQHEVSETSADKNHEAPDCSKRALCTLYCRYGYLKGRDGCDICRCARRSTDRRQARIERRFGKTDAPQDVCGVRAMCTMYCPQGFQKDSKGCDMCVCRQDPPVHAAQLPAGDTNNSPAQLPANIPAQLPAQLPANIPSQQADNVPAQLPAETPAQLPASDGCSARDCHRRKQCAFGFAKDEDGCDTCVCSNRRSSRPGNVSNRRNS